jgi:signal transduction histidine kinase
MFKFLNYKDKKILLFIIVTTILIFSFLYFILTLHSFLETKSEFIAKNAQQLTKEISLSVYSKDYSLSKNIIEKSYLLDFIDKIELKDMNNNIIILKNKKNQNIINLSANPCKNIIHEAIYYENKIIGNLSYCIHNNFLKPLENNIINTVILSLLILTLLFIIVSLINSKAKAKDRANEENQIQLLISHLSKLFSHDFRKPFNLLKMLLSNIKKSKNNHSEMNDLNSMIISEIEKNINRVDSLIHDVIELGSEVKINNEILDLKMTIENTINSTYLNNEINKFKIYLNLINTGKVNIDLSKFNRVISNLISYTIRNNSNQDNIWIKTGNMRVKNKSFIFIKIGSKTHYIPREELELVFNLFYINKIKGSSSLELAICKKIIESHNGFIKCSSSKIRGTEFIIHLPNYNC